MGVGEPDRRFRPFGCRGRLGESLRWSVEHLPLQFTEGVYPRLRTGGPEHDAVSRLHLVTESGHTPVADVTDGTVEQVSPEVPHGRVGLEQPALPYLDSAVSDELIEVRCREPGL